MFQSLSWLGGTNQRTKFVARHKPKASVGRLCQIPAKPVATTKLKGQPGPPVSGFGYIKPISRNGEKIKMTDNIVRIVTPLIVTLCLFGGTTTAGGLTSEQLVRAGYICGEAGPNDWIHCFLARKFGQPSIPVKVFSQDGTEFLGTELLLRADKYRGNQPCPQDGLDIWDPFAVEGYLACHHFDTGHEHPE